MANIKLVNKNYIIIHLYITVR